MNQMNVSPTKHILIVDDSVDSRILLKTLLEAHGFTTDSTSNGHEALVLLKSLHKLPDVILLDLRMPIMDGFRFREIQTIDVDLRDIPVLILSGEEDLEAIHAQTKAQVIQKPYTTAALLGAINKF